MATQLTPKENLLRLLHGDFPQHIPQYNYGPFRLVPDEDPPKQDAMIMPLMGDMFNPAGGKDLWGVPQTPVAEVGGFSLPTPDLFLLDDITKWRDVVKIPEHLKDMDWKAVAEKTMAELPFSRENTAVWYNPAGIIGFFLQLMSFMGFTEGLCAMIEEPDEVKAMYKYMHDFYMGIAVQIIDIIKPDVIGINDDAASERAPFISKEMYREFLIPQTADYCRLAIDRGIPVCMHLCGHGEDFAEDLVRVGVTAWENAQLSNDLHEIQKKYGRHFVVGGGWEGRGRLLDDDVTDEEIRQSVRDAIDAYAPAGGYMFNGAFTPRSLDDPETMRRNKVIVDEAYKYGRNYYDK
jgi:hypothetical protein